MASFEKLRVFQIAEVLADDVWHIVTRWNQLAQHTVGEQLIRSSDGIGSNIAERTGRGSYKDNRRFVRIARGSLYETRYWLRRAFKRKLLTEEQVARLKSSVDELGPKLNAYLNSIGPTPADEPPDDETNAK